MLWNIFYIDIRRNEIVFHFPEKLKKLNTKNEM